MPLYKDSFDKAKRHAHERLTGWITDIRQENEAGIERLQRQFKHTFKKIEYVPKDIQRRRTNEEKKKTYVDKARVSTALNDEIQDSNSSNLSSRLENIRDDVRITESRTPYNKTPLLIPDTDSKDSSKIHSDINKQGDTQSVLNGVLRVGQERRRSSMIPGVLPGIMPFHKRRRSSRLKRITAAQNSDVQNIEVVTEADEDAGIDEALNDQSENDQSTIAKKSSSVLSSTGPTPRQNIKSFKPLKVPGHVDILLRRATRQHRKNLPSKHELPTVKAEQTSEERRKELLTKFRRCIRLLIHVRVLLNVSRIRVQQEEKSRSFKRYDGGLELSFDATAFKCAVSYSGLTSRAKQALKKNPKDRTTEDAKILMEIFVRLPMFMKYSKTVKQALARMIWYDTFQDGRVIVKQGDPGTRMYFVISGEVDLKRTDELDTGEKMSYHLRTVREGATFGELALIRNVRREFTAVCRGTSEFLSLSKDEFNHALRSRWEKDCNKRFNFLRTCEHFTAWTDKQLQICADSSELKEYRNNSNCFKIQKVILGDMDGATENVYFIRSGKCEIVRRILVVRHQSPYQRPNILLPKMAKRRAEFLNKPYCRDRRIDREEIRFLTVTSLLPGNYFGVGENLQDTFILSRGKTELLIINAAQFSIQGKSEQLRRLKRERENSIPSNKALFKKFQENRKWFEYRNQLIKDILLRKKTHYCVSVRDVPRSVLTEPTIPKDIVFYNRKY